MLSSAQGNILLRLPTAVKCEVTSLDVVINWYIPFLEPIEILTLGSEIVADINGKFYYMYDISFALHRLSHSSVTAMAIRGNTDKCQHTHEEHLLNLLI